MRTLTVQVVFFVAILACACSSVQDGALQGEIVAGKPIPDNTLAESMQRNRVPAVSIAVIRRGEIDWAKGYGVLKSGGTDQVDHEALFQAASISKPVTAAGALRMVENGELALDENVNQKLQSWKIPENDFTTEEPVTLRRLLSHSAGLTVHGFPGYAGGTQLPTLVQVLDGEKPARFQHGGGNEGYRCFLVLSVESGDGLVIMTNSDSGEALIDEIFTAIAAAYGWSA